MLNFWNHPQRLRPKNWPKQGQHFSKFSKFKVSTEVQKDDSKITTLCKNKTKITSPIYFWAFKYHLSQKN
jgi:hypothetical protein